MFRNVNILLAEDDRHDAFLLKRAFAQKGVNAPVEVVQDGEEAINYLSGSEGFSDRSRFPLPHLLILDLKMPKRDGFQVLKWVRSQTGVKQLPVLVFSSSAEIRDVNWAYELGANGYSVKPADGDELDELVESFKVYWLKQNRYPDLKPCEKVAL